MFTLKTEALFDHSSSLGVHDSKGQVNTLFFAIDVPGKTVKPVLLGGTFHDQQAPGEQGEPDEVGWPILLSELEDSGK